MKLSIILFTLLCLITACNISDDGPTQVVKKACEKCSTEQVCFEDLCCTPIAECRPDQCGEIDDGCGSTLDCGTCGCFNDNFAEFCPARPCETAINCNDNKECVYEAISCDGAICQCDDDTCTDEDLRHCRDQNALVCPGNFCDPSPKMENGKIVFQNTCVQPDGASCDSSNLCAEGVCDGSTCIEAECGLCNLGVWECVLDTTEPSCFDIPSPLSPGVTPNCNSNSPDSTFIYVDHISGTDSNGSGTTAQPFKTLTVAIAAAKLRGAKGVIIRSGLIETSTLTIENGISLYGGFSGAPDWKYDGGTFNVEVVAPDLAGNVVGILAHTITEHTVLYQVNILSGPATTPRSSSYGLHAVNANALVLEGVNIVAGPGAKGRDGRSGARGKAGGNGTAGLSRRGAGIGGKNAACPNAEGSDGGLGSTPGGAGANGRTTPKGILGGQGGLPDQNGKAGRTPSFGIVAGSSGSGGTRTFSLESEFYLPTGDGRRGTPGSDGYGGSGGGGSGGRILSGSGLGGGGGGGASGGCGGQAGDAGLAGGGSFGVFALSSTGIQIIRSAIKSSRGGNGGNGGAGGGGGTPGNSGSGGLADSGRRGGRGGEGSAGGSAGSGGGGAGGDTYAIFCENTNISPVETTLEHGEGGIGGSSILNGENGDGAESFNCDP